ncbi:MAG: sleB [Rhizobiaceae bacterium]|nr:sleB [Rhizobiaceae bacterium]
MHRRLVTGIFAATSPDRRFLSPLIVGIGMWLGFPTVAAYQDVTSLVSGVSAPSARWTTVVEKSVAGSVHAAELPFADGGAVTASISGAGIVAPGIGAVSFRGKTGRSGEVPDEERIVRSGKKGRVVKVVPVAPPKPFGAGSMFRQTRLLIAPAAAADVRMAFARPDIRGKEVAIAAAFYAKKEKQRDAAVPAFLADLVNNEKADILATAYAPPAPDYAQASPFLTLLKEEDPAGGRFVPPLAAGDHSWMAKPLPASVFSRAEQKCLATAIYFEARGESARGQAAVAQVVLNRVRNPAYPATICGVVYQNDNWRNRCQFSFACDGVKDRIASRTHYERAEEIAMAVTAGKIFLPEVASSTHYYADYVNPRWSRTMEKMKKIGLHIFYRTYGGGWS